MKRAALFALLTACSLPPIQQEEAVLNPLPLPNQGVRVTDQDIDEPEIDGPRGPTGVTGPSAATGTSGPTGMTGPTAATYSATCDGSAGVALNDGYFLNFNDEDQRALAYERGKNGGPVSTVDFTNDLALAPGEEADIEDATRVSGRIYVITSHGRNSDGKLRRARHRFFAIDVDETTLSFAGMTQALLDNMLDSANWTAPDASLLQILKDASRLDKATVAKLAPEKEGINIEGLAAWPSAQHPNRLAIGLRNPRWNNAAIVVTLLNPDEVVTGATAKFGQAHALDLGGLGIRSLTAQDGGLFVLAGPSDGASGPFSVYTWDGVSAATALVALPQSEGSPEALLLYEGTRYLQVLVDQGDKSVGGVVCKDAATNDRSFSDVVVSY
jgi:hypothetical protein